MWIGKEKRVTSSKLDSTAASPTFTPSMPGAYGFTLVVNDGTEDSAPDSVVITVEGQPPVAVAGTSLDANDQLELNGSLSTDPDGTIVTYSWQIAGEASPRLGQIFTIADLLPGEYTVELTVIDDDGLSSTDTMLFGVPPSPTGAGVILSRNPDFSTNDTDFDLEETLYMRFVTEEVDFSNLKLADWQLEAAGGMLTNHLDGSYTAQVLLDCSVKALASGEEVETKVQVQIEDNVGGQFVFDVFFTLTNNGPACP